MSNDERHVLQRRVSGIRSRMSNLRELGSDVFLAAGNFSFFVVLLWLLIAWVVRALFDIEIGWGNPHRMTIIFSIVTLCFTYLLVSMTGFGALRGDLRQKLVADIENQVILIDEYSLTDTIKFEELEHGGFIYFFRTTDGKVYVSYDNESQDLSVGGQDRNLSSFVPRSRLRIGKTPLAGICVSEEFVGDVLPVDGLLPMSDEIDNWPEDGEFVDVQWSEIVGKFSNS